jgi:hypothetical protein
VKLYLHTLNTPSWRDAQLQAQAHTNQFRKLFGCCSSVFRKLKLKSKLPAFSKFSDRGNFTIDTDTKTDENPQQELKRKKEQGNT